MSKHEDTNYIYLVWRNPDTRNRFVVGELLKNDGFEFHYCYDYKNAKNEGFQDLIQFPKNNIIYKNKNMFPSFAARLPDRKRRDIDRILNKYGLENYDEFELLKKSGARLPIDSIEFADPTFEEIKISSEEDQVIIYPEKPARKRKYKSLDDLFEGYTGDYVCTEIENNPKYKAELLEAMKEPLSEYIDASEIGL